MRRSVLIKKVEMFREKSASSLKEREQRKSARASLDSFQPHVEGEKHILICDDQKLNGDLVRIFLTKKEIPSDYAKNGLEAFRLFEKSPLGYYSTILMDVRMPVMDGHEATKAIRALDRDDAKSVTIIAMTADAFAQDTKRCLDAGMNSLLSKPVDQKELYERLL